MTGKQLLEALQKLSPEDLDREVTMEGCDCNGDCDSVEVFNGDIWLNRPRF